MDRPQMPIGDGRRAISAAMRRRSAGSGHYVPVAEFDGSGLRPCVAAHRATVARVLLGDVCPRGGGLPTT